MRILAFTALSLQIASRIRGAGERIWKASEAITGGRSVSAIVYPFVMAWQFSSGALARVTVAEVLVKSLFFEALKNDKPPGRSYTFSSPCRAAINACSTAAFLLADGDAACAVRAEWRCEVLPA